jgi:hypothetical protein
MNFKKFKIFAFCTFNQTIIYCQYFYGHSFKLNDEITEMKHFLYLRIHKKFYLNALIKFVLNSKKFFMSFVPKNRS